MPSRIEPPNLLIILTDQQRYDALSANGGSPRTPHIDSLAASGVNLQKHYAQAPVCVPSRSTLFTGRYPRAHGVMENFVRIPNTEIHLFKVLQKAGFWLSYHGKNHLLSAEEMTANFQHFSDPEFVDRGDPHRARYIALEREMLARLSTHGSFASACFHDFPDEVTTSGVIATDVISTLDRAPTDRPWCTVASFFDPHVPHLAPRRFAEMYPAGSMRVPPLPQGDIFAGKPGRLRIKHQAQRADRATDAEKRHYLSVYASMVTFVDEQIGRILGVLRERPDADRTLILFTSDHGDFCWHHGLCKKDLVLYEDLLHVPAVINWPGALKPQTVDYTFTEHTDFMPTLLDLAGLEVPPVCQGRSFAPLLRGEASSFRDATYAEVCFSWMRNPFPDYAAFCAAWESTEPTQVASRSGTNYNIPGDHTKAVRTDGWSYMWYGDGFEELYHLENDPDEWYNLAENPAYIGMLHAMRNLLRSEEAKANACPGPESISPTASSYPDWITVPTQTRSGAAK